jgi:predicted TIM-barrel fold metal-dependent hydrolase
MENNDVKKTRIIAVEEHYATPAFLEACQHPLRDQAKISGPGPTLLERLGDVGDLRAEEMESAGIDMQVISLVSPGVQQMDTKEAAATAREQNDFLANKLKYYPDRFAGLAALPTIDPEQAAKELERTVSQYGFKGAAIAGHTRRRYLDDEFFRPILESAAALQVPIYIQPARPPQKVIEAYYCGDYAPAVTRLLSSLAWGHHIETAVHCLRLAVSGAFDRYPSLQIVIGNMGEAIPFLLPRIDQYLPRQDTYLERSMGEYLRENFFYTFGGLNNLAAFIDLLSQVGIDRIMFSADYPFSSMLSACTFLEQLPLSPADKERIAHGNAERLLQV